MVEINNCFGWTPIMVAAREGDIVSVRNIVEDGGDLFISNKYGYTLLSLAIVSKNYETFSYIFDTMLTDAIDKFQEDKIAFGLACYEGGIEIVNKFLETKLFDVNETVLYGLTPLLLAASNGQVETARILMKAGANKYAKNLQKQTGYDIALFRKDSKMQALLSEGNANKLLTPIRLSNKRTLWLSPQFRTIPNIKLNHIHDSVMNSGSPHNLVKVNLFKKYPDSFRSGEFKKENQHHSYCHYTNTLLSPQIFRSNNCNRKRSSPCSDEQVANYQKKSKQKNEGCIPWLKYKKTLFRRTPKNNQLDTLGEECKKVKRNMRITRLLTMLDLEEYISAFILHEVDADTILHITEKDLTTMGISDSTKHEVILNKIFSFQEENNCHLLNKFNV